MTEAEIAVLFNEHVNSFVTIFFGYFSIISAFLAASYLAAKLIPKLLACAMVALYSTTSLALIAYAERHDQVCVGLRGEPKKLAELDMLLLPIRFFSADDLRHGVFNHRHLHRIGLLFLLRKKRSNLIVSEYELLDAFESHLGTAVTFFVAYISATSTFLVVAYLAAEDLRAFVANLVAALYSLSSIFLLLLFQRHWTSVMAIRDKMVLRVYPVIPQSPRRHS